MKAYHYTHKECYFYQIGGGRTEGLLPQSKLAKYAEDQRRAIFLLLEPTSWEDNDLFPTAWLDLRVTIGRLLLEVELEDLDPSIVFIADAAYEYGSIRAQNQHCTPDGIGKYWSDSLAEGARKYLESMIPLADYLHRQSELNYTLPEVMILGEVPVRSISVPAQQPLLLPE